MNNEAARIVQSLKAGRYADAERMSCAWIKRDPLAAQGWVLLGEALLRQGDGAIAKAVFHRAALLDPQAAWIDTAHAALANAPRGTDRPEIARRLATKHVSVAAAVMTRNNEQTIERCLRSVTGAVDEIVVLDSSSTDRTLELAGRYRGVKIVKDLRVEDDFAAKRNQGLAYIDSDWVLWIDADEWLEPDDVQSVRDVAGLFDDSPIPPVLQICQMNTIGNRQSADYSLPRMFPLGRGLRYYGRVHEQVIREGQGVFDSELMRRSVRIRLHHDGYEPEIVRNRGKIARNLRLLRLMIEEDPDNPGWWLYCGRETMISGDYDEAETLLLEAERRAEREPRFGRLSEIHLGLIHMYYSKGRWNEAEQVCLRSLAANPEFPDTHYWLAQVRVRKAAALLKQAERHFQLAKQAYPTYRGLVSADREIYETKADEALARLARLKTVRDRTDTEA